MCTTVPGGKLLLARTHKNQLNFISSAFTHSLRKWFTSRNLQSSRKCNCFIRAADLHSKIFRRCHFIWFISDKNVKFEIKCFWTSFSICLVQTCDNIWVYLLLGWQRSEAELKGRTRNSKIPYKTRWSGVSMCTFKSKYYTYKSSGSGILSRVY